MPRTRTTRTRSRSPARRSPRVKKAVIGRFDGDLKTIAFTEGDTINDLLNKADIRISSGEVVNDDKGDEVKLSDRAIETTYYLTGNYDNGQ